MKQIANLYSFNAAERRVIVQGLIIPQARLLLIVNATRNHILYSFAGPGSTAYAMEGGNTVVTLEENTSAFSDADSLTIYYDDGASREEITALSDLITIRGAHPASWLASGDVPVDPVKSISLSEITGIAPDADNEVLTANPGRNYLLIQNLSSAPFHISFGGTATTSTLRIDAFGSIVFDGGVVASNAIRMIRTVAGQQYYIAHA